MRRATLALTGTAVALALSEPAVSALIADRYTSDIVYAFTRDIEFICISLAMMVALGSASFWLKAMVHAFATIQITSFMVNVATQAGIIADGGLWFALITGIIVALRNVRAVQKFEPNTDGIYGTAGLWRIYAKPSSILTWFLFTLDTASGHYSVTDGNFVWYFSHGTGCMVKEKLSRSWLRGKVAKPIASDHIEVKARLNAKVGTKFTTLQNCATILRAV